MVRGASDLCKDVEEIPWGNLVKGGEGRGYCFFWCNIVGQGVRRGEVTTGTGVEGLIGVEDEVSGLPFCFLKWLLCC